MNVGDLVKYNYPGGSAKLRRPHEVLMVLRVNTAGGTLQCLSTSGARVDAITSYCEVVSEKN